MGEISSTLENLVKAVTVFLGKCMITHNSAHKCNKLIDPGNPFCARLSGMSIPNLLRRTSSSLGAVVIVKLIVMWVKMP